MSTILVTTGATVTFRQLIETVVCSKFINSLIDLGVSRLFIQYGNEVKGSQHISRQFFQNQLKKSKIVEEFGFTVESNATTDTMRITGTGLEVTAFPFSPQIQDYIQQADIVISHAGTGSIIDTLRSQKKLIVVVNDQLMDNHQEEIADEFVKLKYCVKYNFNDDFARALTAVLKQEFEKFQENDGSILQSIIAEELG
ncbi:ALG13 [Candida theae]|uniref:UDP-N-acetylglucosamine transferase subunit ALG13 n=1 Tax=Candida theae TaxID=1198502 RepID=A0AAD5BJ56_9ASCO|nr:ALG13 [Candida theae]KAI5966657.1 ALG13 [Candida theae]